MPLTKKKKKKYKAKVLTYTQGPWGKTPINYGFRGIFLGMAVFGLSMSMIELGVTT